MAATIKVNLVDNSKEWVAGLKSRFIEGGGAAEDFEGHLEQLNNELSSRESRRAAEQIKQLADEIEAASPAAVALAAREKQLAAEIKECSEEAARSQRALQRYVNTIQDVDKAAKAAGKSVGGIGGGGDSAGLTALATGATAAIAVFGAIGKGAQGAYQFVSQLAETSPRYKVLKEELDGVWGAVKKGAEEWAASDFGANTLRETGKWIKYVGTSIEDSFSLWDNLKTIQQATLAEINEGLGLQSGHNRAVISEIHAQNMAVRERLELEKKQQEFDASSANATKVRATVAQRIYDAEYSRRVAAMETETQIIASIKQEEAALLAKEKAGKVTDLEAEAAALRLNALNARRRQLQDEEDAKQKRERADNVAKMKKDAEDKIARERKASEEIIAIQKREQEELLRFRQKRRDEEFEIAQKEREEKQKAAQEAAAAEAQKQAQAQKQQHDKTVQAQGGNAQMLVGSISPLMVARHMGEKRATEAQSDWMKKNKKKAEDAALRIARAKIKIRNLKNNKQEVPKELQKELSTSNRKFQNFAKDFKKTGVQARQSAFRDVANNRVDSQEVADAQTELTNNVINNGVKTGQINKAQAATIREAAQQLIEQQRELQAVYDEINAVRRMLANRNKGSGQSGN